MTNAAHLSLLALAFVVAGLVKGVVGMGLPTIAMSLLSLSMPPVEAAALLLLPTIITNAWQLVTGPSLAALSRRFLTLLIGICVGSAFGVHWLTGGNSSGVSMLLGAVLAIYGALGLASIHFTVKPAHEPWLSPLVGVATGVLAGATGVSVIPVVFYLNSLALEREDLIQAMGLAFTISSLALAIGLSVSDEFSLTTAGASLLALMPAVGGMLLGQSIRTRLAPATFRRWFFIGLLVLGLYIGGRALVSGA